MCEQCVCVGGGVYTLKVTKLLALVFWLAAEISAMDRMERFSCGWQRSVDCVFCVVNNKVRTYARGKLMSDHKDLGKSFASGHEHFTLARRGPQGTRGETVIVKSRRPLHKLHVNTKPAEQRQQSMHL